MSQSEMWRAANRIKGYIDDGFRPIILHLGDHDPSGLDMTRDIKERLELFVGEEILVDRLALNMSQIEDLKPPPNPTKVSDSRASAYLNKFGTSCWELDALEQAFIASLIRNEIKAFIWAVPWKEAKARQKEGRKLLERLSDRWDNVIENLMD